MTFFSRLSARATCALALLSPLGLAACGDMLFQPSEGGSASLAVGYQLDPRFSEVVKSIAAANGSSSAFDKADRVWVRVTHSGTVLHDSVHAFTPAAEVRLQIPLPSADAAQNLQVSLELRRGSAAIFAGYAQTMAEPGATTEAMVELMPMPAAIVVPDSLTIASLGDATISGAAVFVTGDTIPDAALSWSSLDPHILTIGAGGQAVAQANGEARVVAASDAAGTLSETIIVTVRQAAATVEITGDTIPMEQSVTPTYRVLDANGFVVDPALVPEVTWTSDNPDVAVTSTTGSVTGAMLGQTTVRVHAGDAVGTMPVKVSPLPGRSLLTGRQNSCAIGVDGDLHCWGSVSGAAWSSYETVPVEETGAPALYMISGAGTTTCGLAPDGSAYCRGANHVGQLGNGTTTSTTTMTQVAGGLAFIDISVGERHACALTATGEVWCWGSNNYGQVGTATGELCGSVDCATTPTLVTGLTAESITAGGFHSCALTAAGEAYCWGWNAFAALGNGTTTNSSVPVLVSGGLQFAQLAGGAVNVCGITTGGSTYCWGYNAFGQAGIGSTGPLVTTPALVSGGHQFVSISMAKENSIYGWGCGTTASGASYCWGADHLGQLGADIATPLCGTGRNVISCSPAPTASASGISFVDVRGGLEHTCGVDQSGVVHCWGSKSFGSLGNGSDGFQTTPALVSGGSTYSDIDAAEGEHTCAVAGSGEVHCWGRNSLGQLGNGTRSHSAVPTTAGSAVSFVQVTGGFGFTCALSSGQSAYCWGTNQWGQVGDGTTTDRLTPTAVTGGVSFQQISSADSYTEGVSTAGERWWWGRGLSTDAAVNSTPQNPGDSLTIVVTATGLSHSCWLTPAGAAYCRGPNNYGQLGDGTNTDGYQVPVAGGHTFTALTAGRYHTCGLTTAGAAYCWGYGLTGQLGNGATDNSNVPVLVGNGSISFTKIDAGAFHTCAVTSAGEAYCWGANYAGKLGDGTLTHRSSPVRVAGDLLLRNVAAGYDHSCGITDSGVAYCWGLQAYGQIGNGSFGYVTTPVTVAGGPPIVVSPNLSPTSTQMTALPSLTRQPAPRRSSGSAPRGEVAPLRPAGIVCEQTSTSLDCRS